MDVMDAVKGMIARSFGNDGAVRNCQVEKAARQRAEAEIDRLCARLARAEPASKRPVA